MNKSDFVAKLAEKTGTSKKEAEIALSGVLDVITESLKAGEKVTFVGFGSFEVKNRPARIARNPQTGKEVKVPATKVPAFKAGKALKEEIK